MQGSRKEVVQTTARVHFQLYHLKGLQLGFRVSKLGDKKHTLTRFLISSGKLLILFPARERSTRSTIWNTRNGTSSSPENWIEKTYKHECPWFGIQINSVRDLFDAWHHIWGRIYVPKDCIRKIQIFLSTNILWDVSEILTHELLSYHSSRGPGITTIDSTAAQVSTSWSNAAKLMKGPCVMSKHTTVTEVKSTGTES